MPCNKLKIVIVEKCSKTLGAENGQKANNLKFYINLINNIVNVSVGHMAQKSQ